MLNQSLIVSDSILLNASIENVWDTMTNPSRIKLYLYGTETITTWIPGEDIIFQGEYEGTKYLDKGTIIECLMHKKITYSYWSGFSGLEDIEDNRSLVTYIITPISETEIQLTWIQSGFANEKSYLHTLNGIKSFLNGIKNVVEMNS